MSKGAQIAGGATLIALLLGWYAVTNLESDASFTYFQQLDEFLVSAQEFEGKQARVHGYVATGSIERDVAAKQVRFRVQNDPPHGASAGNGGTRLQVVYAGLETPDLFKDGAEVVVEGHLVGGVAGGEFRADKVMAKCPSKFEPESA